MNRKSILKIGSCILIVVLLLGYFCFVPLYIKPNTPAEQTTLLVTVDEGDGSPCQSHTGTPEETKAFLSLLTSQPFRRLKTEHRQMYGDDRYYYFKLWDETRWIGLHVVLPNDASSLNGFVWTDDGHMALNPAPFYDLAQTVVGKGSSAS